jgi:hypothetical protein
MLAGFFVALLAVIVTGWVTRDFWLTEPLRGRLSGMHDWMHSLLERPPDQAVREQLLRQHRLEMDALHRRWQSLVAERKAEVQRLEHEIQRLQGSAH